MVVIVVAVVVVVVIVVVVVVSLVPLGEITLHVHVHPLRGGIWSEVPQPVPVPMTS